MNGDFGLVRPVASVIGQEGEQNSFCRSMLGKVPSTLPFLITGTGEFAFSSLVQTVVARLHQPTEPPHRQATAELGSGCRLPQQLYAYLAFETWSWLVGQ